MTNVGHPVLVIGTIGLSLSVLLFCAYLINFLSQKANATDGVKQSARINMSSIFEQAAITCTITGLYAALMILFFVVIS